MEINLTSKHALVGASSRGIGLAIATQLADCGANVTLMARDEKRLNELITNLSTKYPEQVHGYLIVDFSDPEDFTKKITDFFADHTVDILINNTNGPATGKATELDSEQYQQAFVCSLKLSARPLF